MPLRHPQQHGKLSCVDHFAFAPHTADRVLRDQRDGKLTLDLVECITTPNKVPQFAVQCDIVAAQQGRHFSPFNLRFKGRMKYRREKHLQRNKNVWKIWKMRNGKQHQALLSSRVEHYTHMHLVQDIHQIRRDCLAE